MLRFRKAIVPATLLALYLPLAGQALAQSEGDGSNAETDVSQAVFATESAAPSRDVGYGLGREAAPEEISAWDIDIRPDGQGLPEGSGDVWTGEEVYAERCASCHGDFGEAVGRWPQLALGMGTLQSEDPVKTVGSYWPYLSTVWDYVHRAMPFGEAQSLTDDEVYAITAYLLYLNEIVDDDFTLSRETFAEVTLPNEGNFYMDDRAAIELGAFSQEPCMENCKESVEIAMRAMVLDVTPDDPTDNASAPAVEGGSGTDENGAKEDAVVQAAAPPKEEEDSKSAEAEEMPAEPSGDAGVDPVLVEAGESVFRRCSACHQLGPDAKNRAGPHLNGIFRRPVAAVEKFKYSKAFTAAAAEGRTWTGEELAAYLQDPKGYLPGTKMAFAGLRSEADVKALIAYLRSAGAE